MTMYEEFYSLIKDHKAEDNATYISNMDVAGAEICASERLKKPHLDAIAKIDEELRDQVETFDMIRTGIGYPVGDPRREAAETIIKAVKKEAII